MSVRTQSEILESLLNNIRDDVSKRKGEIVWDVSAALAYEVEMLEWENHATRLLGFADTSEHEYLERRTAELGITRKPATKAVGQVVFTGSNGAEIPKGLRVFTNNTTPLYFVTTENAKIIDGKASVPVEAVEAGSAGNIGIGEIVGYEQIVGGIDAVANETEFAGGVNAETDEELLGRYLFKVRKPITSGNVYHYEKWATDIEGVAAARVFPIWDGPGTVKVVVIGRDGKAPDAVVMDAVTEHIERERPIGATVTVVGISEVPLSISAKLTLAGDLKADDVKQDIIDSITAYIVEETRIIRYAKIANAIIETKHVIDYEDLLVNGGTANIPIALDSVAVVGEVDFV
ncbi:baseplate J/gp47 family protein [Bacillus chungangensis]|uniref:Phage protein gp47/JayE n=1 Tax=Bacillus chungangensis TaxID=587633 RepID=A0ABT9WM49_9BACI|nr:baseplate J/gp47 family protein [Bacillus chungangensis]MDQ0174370.1 putative phage protein gp47/JayE [Bacillus chungangensis]